MARIEGGYSVGLNRVRNYMNELGLKVIYPTKKVCTTLAHPEHKKYPYLLRDLEVYKPNQVWSTDITYIRLDGGFVYLAAVIDWHSKAILSHKISTTMDSSLVINVLKQALERYGTPEIFNTDQGSQYTSHDHTQLLRKRRYLGRYFAHPMMQNRRAKRDDYKPSAVRVTQRYVP
ncbi:transposase [Piscirickettsia salmonis]|uniref:Transposase n=1 Tax=Piscirickettsia salmonis TaxID=1238 RepID=A0AAC8VJ02_PISSA|nr:transposase [Piscirickettsia salmonis]QGO01607.1 putative transposase OrfB [Piscirickettsia salmonis]